MKIGFDAKRLFKNNSGLGNYSRDLVRVLDLYSTGQEFILYTTTFTERPDFSLKGNMRVVTPRGIGRWMKKFWRGGWVCRDIRHDKADIYHGLSHQLPLGIEKTGVKSVVTIHDLIFVRFPGLYSAVDVMLHKSKVAHACHVADVVVAISEQTKRDLIEFTDVDPSKVRVVYQGCNPVHKVRQSEEQKAKVRRKFSLPDDFILYVGTIEERKNLLSVLEAIWEMSAVPLVVVGKKSSSYFRKVEQYIRKNGMEGRVFFLENLLPQEIASLYQSSRFFIYPSIFEGFGIPIIEALFNGVPVITSKGSCFAEAGGGGALYIDPYNVEEISDAIESLWDNATLRTQMVERGQKHVEQFRDQNIATEMLRVYESLM